MTEPTQRPGRSGQPGRGGDERPPVTLRKAAPDDNPRTGGWAGDGIAERKVAGGGPGGPAADPGGDAPWERKSLPPDWDWFEQPEKAPAEPPSQAVRPNTARPDTDPAASATGSGAGDTPGVTDAEGPAGPGGGKSPLSQSPPRWDWFGPAEERPPGRAGRALAGVGRFAAHEWTVVSVLGLLLAVVFTWPTMLHPASTIPQDIYDPLLQTWQVAWDGHALLTDPLHLWDTNTFFPEHDTLAYSDSLLGYAPLGLLGSGAAAALVRYNVLYVLVYALAFVGMYALCRQLGARWAGAAMAAAAFAYAPWRLAHGGHLNILSTGGIALALAMLARGHDVSLRRRTGPPRYRWGWALGGWLVAAWQVTLGFGLGLPFGYLLGVAVLVGIVRWVVRHRRSLAPSRLLHGPEWPAFSLGGVGRWCGRHKLLWGNLGGLVAFGLTCLYMGLPYLRVVQEYPNARRSVADLALFSPPLQGFLIAPEQSWLWGDAHATARQALPFQPEMTLLVGVVLLGFAVMGLFLSSWSWRVRLGLALGVVLSVALGMGTRFPGGGEYTYLLLYRYLPAWDSMRTPGRLVVWTTLLLGLLAAGAVSSFGARAGDVAVDHGRNRRQLGLPLRFALVIPLLLALVEGWNRTPHPTVPLVPPELRAAHGPVLLLPSDQLSDQITMYWSTDGFPTMVNGGSGFQPPKQDEIRRVAAAFPNEESVAYLRKLGVRTVIVLRDRIAGTPYQNSIAAPVDGLDLDRRDTGAAVIFTLR